jgi:hypothetical protein
VIVLDEHLKKVGVQEAIRRWYRGSVCTIRDLRPGTTIKDEVVPVLLQAAAQPTFVTVDWMDFWQRVVPHSRFCLICFTLPPDRGQEMALLLRRLFRLPEFKTKAARMGKIARISGDQVSCYQTRDAQVYVLPLP